MLLLLKIYDYKRWCKVILLDSKSKNSSSSPLALVTPKNEKGISFSDLLRGVSEKKDAKGVQNGSLILSLGSDIISIFSYDCAEERRIDSDSFFDSCRNSCLHMHWLFSTHQIIISSIFFQFLIK